MEKNYNRKDSETVKNSKLQESPYHQLSHMLKQSFISVNAELENHVPNCQFSGTTTSIVLTRGP